MNTFIRLIKLIAIVAAAILLICFSAAAGTDIQEQKQELEKIKTEIEDSKRNLDSLRNIEKQVQKDISEYEQRASMNKTVLNRLNRQLSSLGKDISSSKEKLSTSEKRYHTSRSRYLNNLKYYYAGIRPQGPVMADEIRKEKDAFKKIMYLKALAAHDKEEVTLASEYLQEADREHTGLIDQEKSVSNVQKKKKSEYTIITSQKEKKERDLSKVRRKKESEADKLITLAEAARQMEELISRLEQARLDRERASAPIDFNFETGNFITYKGGLATPLKGKVVSSFGWKTDKITKLKSYSPGIEVAGKAKAQVLAVASGMVAYIGNLRGYDNFVIVEHEDGYYSTYAGLDDLRVVQNQIIYKGDKLGITSDGKIKFELRQGREPLDPIEWIKIDSFK